MYFAKVSSIETVYQRVYADKRNGGILWKNLRCQKQRRKRYGKTDRRGIIPNRQSIEQRPAIVDARSRIGDWEADTIIGKNHRQAIVSLVERKTTEAVIKATTRLLKPHRRRVHTITSDNGLPAESTDIYLKNIPGTCTVPNNKSRPSAACT
ncbi:IS30 family transposase [Nitrosomonas ureae]|uniref:IS30 family transposase n=1 Tax=Nitrosomonas ureae TaxID=44577 RepID=UPI000BE2A5FB|nr:IS30 family transposase [Nitrosomonas ureae]